MNTYRFGETDASVVLIQPLDEHDLPMLESEVRHIRELTEIPFRLTAVQVQNWARDLSPWKAPAVFGKEDFGDGAEETLRQILQLTDDRKKTYILGGYSLAGLFALWSVFHSDAFFGVAAASPSIWFPGFLDHIKERKCHCGAVYLSLGDREEKTRNPVMRTVGERICEGYELLKASGVETALAWNQGNHFKDPDIRTAKAFAWVMQRLTGVGENGSSGAEAGQ